jgi:hypothetical protein
MQHSGNDLRKIALLSRIQRLPFIHKVALAGLILRTALAVTSGHINQADEIFQYLEQGHRLAFGYGNVPWEYRFEIRSYLIPGLIAGILKALEFLHLGSPDAYVPSVKVIFAALSLSLIYSVHSIGRSLFSEAAGRAAAIFTACWYELVYFASKPTPEVLGMYCLFAALACVVAPRSVPRAVGFGLVCGLAVALRIQYAPVVAIMGLVALYQWSRADSLRALGAAAIVVLGAGLLDYVTWGGFLASYWNAINFEKLHGISRGLFGTRPIYYYLAVLTLASGGLFLVALAVALRHARQSWVVIACMTTLLAFHSLFAHKEYRFVVATIPFMCLFLGQATTWLAGGSRRAAILAAVAISVAGLLHALPFERTAYREALYKRADMVRAYSAVRRDPELAAIWVPSHNGDDTAGYYHLHRNIPIYYRDQLLHRNITLDPGSTVSHILCPLEYPDITGFRTVGRFGLLELRKQTNPPSLYKRPYDTKDLLMRGIDGVLRSPIDKDL